MPVTKLVDLTADVMPFLQMAATPSDGGAKLQEYIDGITPVIEDVVGHVIQTSITGEIHDGGDTTIYLREVPVLSVDQMVEVIGIVPYTLTLQPVGHPVDNFGFTLDDPAVGRITRRSAGSQEFEFYDNVGNISVNYTAGRSSVPGNVKLATLELIKLVYVPEQESFGETSTFVPSVIRDESNDEEMSVTPSGYLIPRRIYSMLQPSRRWPTFA